MNPILRNVLAVIAAAFIGSLVNMGIIIFGSPIVGVPEGVDPMNVETIKANASLYSAKHFIVPFLAHALGTLVGAFLVCKMAASKYKVLATVIGVLFLIGGIMVAMDFPGFWKFSIIDILFAYMPMAYLGWVLAGKPE